MLYVRNIDSEEPIMVIDRHIGFDDAEGMGVDGSLFSSELMTLDNMGKKRIQVWINSVGGVVMDGYNICMAIQKSKTPVDTYCLGMAASIAGVIFQTGRKRVMADYGILMYHNPYAGATTESPLLDSMKSSLNKIISQRSGMNEDAVQRMMDRTSFIMADEAVSNGLCDEVEVTEKLNKKYIRVTNDAKVNWLNANKVLNQLFDKNKSEKMLKVTNKLGLNADAKEESILDAIEKVENRATEAENALAVQNKKSADEMDALNKKVKEAEDALASANAELAKAKADIDASNKEKLEAENKVKAEKAKNLVHDAVKIGRIKNDPKVVDAWIVDATEDHDKVKARLEAIPMNKSSVKFEIKTEAEADKAKYGGGVAADMVTISNRLK